MRTVPVCKIAACRSAVLPVLRPATKAALENAMQGHILAQDELVGYYRKQK